MATIMGIQAGETRTGSAGANRGTVSMTLTEDGQLVTVGDTKIKVMEDTLVFFHKDSAGTYHGLHCPEELKTVTASQAKYLRVGTKDSDDVRGIEKTSSSGGGDIAALVVKVTKPIAIVTSGYRGRRGWLYTIVSPDGACERYKPEEYRAKFVKDEEALVL